jgi:pyridoxal 5'-phosphate synthase pdxT subunit
MIIGVLALQGAVREHTHCLQRLGIESRIVKTEQELHDVSGLILPGGESTTMSLLAGTGLLPSLRGLAERGIPLFGTCAGMILLASEVEGRSAPHIDAIDITVSRNATGRQVDSFETVLRIADIGEDVPAVFIRAPYITRHGPRVRLLAQHSGYAVMAREGHVLVASFHPELTDDLRVHAYFAEMVGGAFEKKP